MASRNTLADAQLRYFLSKFPFAEVNIQNIDQCLVKAAAFQIAKPLVSAAMGRPSTINVMIRVNAACNITVEVGPDSSDVFAQQIINFTGAGEKVVQIPGCNVVTFATDVDLTTATIRIQANY